MPLVHVLLVWFFSLFVCGLYTCAQGHRLSPLREPRVQHLDAAGLDAGGAAVLPPAGRKRALRHEEEQVHRARDVHARDRGGEARQRVNESPQPRRRGTSVREGLQLVSRAETQAVASYRYVNAPRDSGGKARQRRGTAAHQAPPQAQRRGTRC